MGGFNWLVGINWVGLIGWWELIGWFEMVGEELIIFVVVYVSNGVMEVVEGGSHL